MKRFLIFVCIFSLTEVVLATDIKGYVIDNQRNPISFASVYLQNNPQIGTITNDKGYFTLTSENADDRLVVTFIGYEKFSMPVKQIDENKVLYITLKDQPILLDAVIVSAKGSKRQQRKQLKQVLEKIHEQLKIDFPDEARNYHLVSDVSVYNEGQVAAFDELVGHVVELPYLRDSQKRDSVQIKADFT